MDLEADALDWAFVGHLLVDSASPLDLDNAFVVKRQGQAQFVVKLSQGHGFKFLASHGFTRSARVVVLSVWRAVTESMMRQWMYAIVTGKTKGVGCGSWHAVRARFCKVRSEKMRKSGIRIVIQQK